VKALIKIGFDKFEGNPDCHRLVFMGSYEMNLESIDMLIFTEGGKTEFWRKPLEKRELRINKQLYSYI
jgi:hypothetical protein